MIFDIFSATRHKLMVIEPQIWYVPVGGTQKEDDDSLTYLLLEKRSFATDVQVHTGFL